jgi:hypothetical protein
MIGGADSQRITPPGCYLYTVATSSRRRGKKIDSPSLPLSRAIFVFYSNMSMTHPLFPAFELLFVFIFMRT